MPLNGSYSSGSIAARSGAVENQTFQLILDALLQSKGSAYNTEEFNTAVFYEMYAYALAIQEFFEANQRMQNQFFPDSMYYFLDRWESILNIIPPLNASVQQRQNLIALYFQRWTKPPTLANLTYFTQQLLGSIFLGFSLYSANEAGIQYIPHGISDGYEVPGGATLNDGYWRSYVSDIIVQIWYPTDKYGNGLIPYDEFIATATTFYNFYMNYLPAYCTFGTLAYGNQGNGYVSGFLGGNKLYGTGTNFTTSLQVATSILVVDDNNNPHILAISSIQSDTQLTLVSQLEQSITGSIYFGSPQVGFILDTPNNLDHQIFAH